MSDSKNSNISRDDYKYFHPLETRWMDNDIYGHVNNVTYYSYFDSAANHYLIERGGLDIQNADIVGFVVASNCQYVSPISYPDRLEIGFRVNKLGNRSVEYGMAVFKSAEQTASAYGSFTHVFVQRSSNRAVPIPESIRTALEAVKI